MKIEDGKGKNGDMSVSSTQRGNVSAKTAPRPMFSARDDGLSFSAIYTFTAAAGDNVAYLKNTSSTRNLFLGDVSFGGVESVLFKLWFCTGTAINGEEVIPTPTNRSKNIPAEADAMAGNTPIAGLTTDTMFSLFRAQSNSTFEEHFDGSVILGPGDALVVEYDSGTAGNGEIDIHFHYENIGAS